jgi:hypothetical protein
MEIKLLQDVKVPPTTDAVGVFLTKELDLEFDNSISPIVNSLLEKEQFVGKDGEILVTYKSNWKISQEI